MVSQKLPVLNRLDPRRAAAYLKAAGLAGLPVPDGDLAAPLKLALERAVVLGLQVHGSPAHHHK
jgi:hypothetical protein